MSQYLDGFQRRLAGLTSDERFHFLIACACEGQSEAANRAGFETLLTEPRIETLKRLEALIGAEYPGADEWVFRRLQRLCEALDAPFRPVLQTEIKC